ncbi:MFS transporter [Rhodococcus sp. 14C212]|uniref:MFS transporter n=1 Tax=Rhodococcus sp. 14C212 TaxID=2711209 RepID=UPI0013EE11EF|nr:MFS transporter [Rhodococcus sp. 14C212]NGP08327.1 MFS transporter [Rhodococcus sp. 14C212]
MLSGVALDVQFGILSPLVGTIAAESQLTASEIGWVLNAMMLGSAVSIGLTTRLGDTYGHRKVLIVLTVLAMLGSLLAATIAGFWPLVIGRFLGGTAAAIPLSWGLLRPRATANQIRLSALALSLTMAIFTPLAIVVGGFFASLGMPWQGVFWVIFVAYAVLLLLALVSPETPGAALVNSTVDWFGAIGLGLWVTALLIGISEGPTRGWTSPLVLGGFTVSAAVLVVWIFQQRNAKAPIMAFRNMDVRQAVVGYMTILGASIPAQGLFVVLPLLLQTPTESGFGHGMSVLESSYVLLAMLPGSSLGYVWTRWGLQRLGPKWVLVISGIAGFVLYLGFAFVQSPSWIFYVWVFFYGLTVLSFLTVGYTLVAASGRQDNMAVTVGMQTIVQFVSSVIVVAVVLNILNPGSQGFIPQEKFVWVYIGMGASILVFVVLWALFAPRRITDLHAIDAETDRERITANDVVAQRY